MKYPAKIKMICAFLMLFASISAHAADTTPPSPVAADTTFTMSVNDVLVGCALLLLLVAVILGNTLRAAIKYYHEKSKAESQSNNSGQAAKTILLLIGCMLAASYPTMAQDAMPAGPTTIPEAVVTRWILYMVIAIELIVIVLFARWIRLMTGIDAYKSGKAAKAQRFNFDKFWTRINRFRPIEEEGSLDTGHSYDGIRELNNVTPPWFIVAFSLSILFGIGYLWRYHVAMSAPLQIEEYDIAVAEAKLKQAEYLKSQANNVDENTVKMLDAAGIAAGQALFTTNCVSCHGAHGQGVVGPNLTDDYWLHKGGIKHVFYSIKYGWIDKGMKSWKDDFSPNQIAQIASYIISLHGSNPANPKEPQGEIYKDDEAAPKAASLDSTKSTAAATEGK